MLTIRRSIMDPALVVAIIALLVALSGVAYAAATIGTAQLKNNAVTRLKIKNGAVSSAKLGGGAVVTSRIAGSAVTSPKIGAGAVTSPKIAAGAVNSSKIGAGAVTSTALETGAVGSGALADNTVAGVDIADGAISSIDVADGGIQAADLAPGAAVQGTGQFMSKAVSVADGVNDTRLIQLAPNVFLQGDCSGDGAGTVWLKYDAPNHQVFLMGTMTEFSVSTNVKHGAVGVSGGPAGGAGLTNLATTGNAVYEIFPRWGTPSAPNTHAGVFHIAAYNSATGCDFIAAGTVIS